MDRLTTRWLSTLGIATLCFGIALFVLRVPIRTISIFLAIGIPLILLWLYVDEKSKQPQNKKQIDNSVTMKQQQQQQQQLCVCSICKHEQARICFEEKCACCLLMKDDRIIGHSIKPLH
jgi:hypothetical protein